MAKKKDLIPKAPRRKKAGRKAGTAYARIRELGKERVDEINSRLIAGEEFTEVAAWMVETFPEDLPDVSQGNLSRQLSRYKRDVLGPDVVSVYEDPTPPKKDAARKLMDIYGMSEVVDGVSVMNEMIALQRERIWKHAKADQHMPLGHEPFRKELRELFDMVKDFYNLQMEMGLVARVPKRVDGQVTGLFAHSKLGQSIDDEIQSHFEVTSATKAVLGLLGTDSTIVDAVTEDQ
jgi:hypothetical protein